MLRRSIAGLDRGGLRLALGAFFLALAIPAAILIWHARGQLKWAAFHQQQQLAEEVAARIDTRFAELVTREEARSFADYAFLVVEGDPAQNFVQRSPLSAFPVEPSIPGLIGYFQVAADGAFSTPLLPLGADATSYGVTSAELEARLDVQNFIWRILSENELVQRNEPRAGELRPGVETGGRAAAIEGEQQKDADSSGAVAAMAPSPSSVESAEASAPTAQPKSGADSSDASSARTDASVSGALSRARSMPAAGAASSRTSAPAQAAFDELSASKEEAGEVAQKSANVLGRVEDLKLDASRYESSPAQPRRQAVSEADALLEKRVVRKEKVALPETLPADTPRSTAAPGALAAAPASGLRDDMRVRTFESEVDPFTLSLLGSGQFVLFRNVWREGQRYVQGLLIEQPSFLEEIAAATFRASALALTTDLVVADRGNVLALYGGGGDESYQTDAAELRGALLYQTHLTAPLDKLELIFSVHQLPPGPGASLLNWVAAILAIVLCGGSYLMYALGAGQIALARQQQDFVSAVSHELKTPLTSIRMYGEMLRSGWGSEAQKHTWYEYIYGESERLSRLINNVLQLARMNCNERPLTLKPVTGAEIVDGIRSKIATQVEQAGFALEIDCEPDAATTSVQVDPDAVLQIVINLVDNAIKFSAKSPEKRIEIRLRRLHDAQVLLSVRDHGPGVPKDQTRRIFELFYRSESELTRETVGTGIGLALVHQLARAMRARVNVLNRDPGAEFRVLFPV